MREPTFIQQFLKDVSSHRLYVEKDDGLYRHLRFRHTDGDGSTSYCMGFDIVTWPGWLAYSGDMGTFVFTRTADMLAFFRKEERGGRTIFDAIDRRYWAEKCQAEGARGDGIMEFDPERFKQVIREGRDRLLKRLHDKLTAEERMELSESIDSDVLSKVDDWPSAAYHVAYEWNYSKGSFLDNTYESWSLNFDDFPNCERYTQRFNWCCCALAWGINQYDKAKAAAQAISTTAAEQAIS